MSIFSAMGTAVSGLSAQSAAFTNISDNIANSQTTGFKSTGTSFTDYLTSSSARQNDSGSVVATPDYENDVQGSITQSSNKLALAISGSGFFNVAEVSGSSSGKTTSFQNQQFYTRNGDFSQNLQGYLVNTSGDYLEGYMANASTGALSSTLQPINVSDVAFRPVPTSTISATVTLPQSQGTTTPSSSVSVYDSAGNAHSVALSWQQSASNANQWTVTATPDGSSAAATQATVTFNSSGTIASIASGGTTTSTLGGTASFSVPVNGASVAIDLGKIGVSGGTAQATDSTTGYSATELSQDGVATANYTGIAMGTNGDVSAVFDNGSTQVIAHVPLAKFANPDGLQRQNGQAFTASALSGSARLYDAGTSGAGTLQTGATEASNVNIDTDLTRLIVAQQAYSANAKVVTTADQMLQTTLQMKQ